MSVSPYLAVHHVFVATIEKQLMYLPLSIVSSKDRTVTIETKALLDSGAGGIFIDHAFAKKHKFPFNRLHTPIPVHNVDGTLNL